MVLRSGIICLQFEQTILADSIDSIYQSRQIQHRQNHNTQTRNQQTSLSAPYKDDDCFSPSGPTLRSQYRNPVFQWEKNPWATYQYTCVCVPVNPYLSCMIHTPSPSKPSDKLPNSYFRRKELSNRCQDFKSIILLILMQTTNGNTNKEFQKFKTSGIGFHKMLTWLYNSQ